MPATVQTGPQLKRTPPCGSIFTGGDAVVAEKKNVVDPVAGGEKALCLVG
jgi:hypothetical protein